MRRNKTLLWILPLSAVFCGCMVDPDAAPLPSLAPVGRVTEQQLETAVPDPAQFGNRLDFGFCQQVYDAFTEQFVSAPIVQQYPLYLQEDGTYRFTMRLQSEYADLSFFSGLLIDGILQPAADGEIVQSHAVSQQKETEFACCYTVRHASESAEGMIVLWEQDPVLPESYDAWQEWTQESSLLFSYPLPLTNEEIPGITETEPSVGQLMTISSRTEYGLKDFGSYMICNTSPSAPSPEDWCFSVSGHVIYGLLSGDIAGRYAAYFLVDGIPLVLTEGNCAVCWEQSDRDDVCVLTIPAALFPTDGALHSVCWMMINRDTNQLAWSQKWILRGGKETE